MRKESAEFVRMDGGKTTIKRRSVTSVSEIEGGCQITRKDGPPIYVEAVYADVVAWWEGQEVAA